MVVVVPTALSKWTELMTVDRSIYFSTFDESKAKSFGSVIFGFTAVLFVNSLLGETKEDSDGVADADIDEVTDANIAEESGNPTDKYAIDDNQQTESTSQSGKGAGNSFVQGEQKGAFSTSEDPVALSSNMQGDLSKYEKLLSYIRFRQQGLVDKLTQGPHQLMSKVVEYIRLADGGYDVFTISMIEAKQDDQHLKIFKTLTSKPAKQLYYLIAVIFIMNEFVTESAVQLTLDIVCLFILTIFSMSAAYFESAYTRQGIMRSSTSIQLVVVLALWILVLVNQVAGVPLLAFVRPVMLFMVRAQEAGCHLFDQVCMQASETLTTTLWVFVQ